MKYWWWEKGFTLPNVNLSQVVISVFIHDSTESVRVKCLCALWKTISRDVWEDEGIAPHICLAVEDVSDQLRAPAVGICWRPGGLMSGPDTGSEGKQHFVRHGKRIPSVEAAGTHFTDRLISPHWCSCSKLPLSYLYFSSIAFFQNIRIKPIVLSLCPWPCVAFRNTAFHFTATKF
jgi:hypothetical protein